MSPTKGRIQKRLRLSVPLGLSKLRVPDITEHPVTENISSLGARVLTRRAMKLNERLMVSSHVGNLRTKARVVYCQRLPDGRFGVGLQSEGVAANFLLAARQGTEND